MLVWGSGVEFRVEGSGYGIKGLLLVGFRVWDVGRRVQDEVLRLCHYKYVAIVDATYSGNI